MAMPEGVPPIIDTMIGFPVATDFEATYGFIRRQTKDVDSKERMRFPAEYMFKDVPEGQDQTTDPVASDVRADGPLQHRGRPGRHRPGRGARPGAEGAPGPVHRADLGRPQRGHAGACARSSSDHTTSSGSAPCRCFPKPEPSRRSRSTTRRRIPSTPSAWRWELSDLGSTPRHSRPPPQGPLPTRRADRRGHVRLPGAHVCHHARMRKPWEELGGQAHAEVAGPPFHCTSAFAPKYYPKAVIDYANTRGSDKVMYAGYYPMGLSLERIMGDMPNVPFRDHVWPKFLHDNAARVLGLPSLRTPGRDHGYRGPDLERRRRSRPAPSSPGPKTNAAPRGRARSWR